MFFSSWNPGRFVLCTPETLTVSQHHPCKVDHTTICPPAADCSVASNRKRTRTLRVIHVPRLRYRRLPMRLNTAFKKSQQMGDLNIVGDGVEFLKQYLPIAEGTTEYDANIGGSLSRLGNSGLTDMFDPSSASAAPTARARRASSGLHPRHADQQQRRSRAASDAARLRPRQAAPEYRRWRHTGDDLPGARAGAPRLRRVQGRQGRRPVLLMS